MKNYRRQPACCACAHVFWWVDYDSDTMLYCNRKKDCPKYCGSGQMSNDFYKGLKRPGNGEWMDVKMYLLRRARWNEWADAHSVADNGVCDCFKQATEEVK